MIAGRKFSVRGMAERNRNVARVVISTNGGFASALLQVGAEVLIYDDRTPVEVIEQAQDLGAETWTMDELVSNAEAQRQANVSAPAPAASGMPTTREESLALIAQLRKQFDIEDPEDMYTNAINAIEAKYQALTGELVKQAMGLAMKASGRKFLVVDPSVLTDQKPYDVKVTDMPNGTCRYQLVGVR